MILNIFWLYIHCKEGKEFCLKFFQAQKNSTFEAHNFFFLEGKVKQTHIQMDDFIPALHVLLLTINPTNIIMKNTLLLLTVRHEENKLYYQ